MDDARRRRLWFPDLPGTRDLDFVKIVGDDWQKDPLPLSTFVHLSDSRCSCAFGPSDWNVQPGRHKWSIPKDWETLTSALDIPRQRLSCSQGLCDALPTLVSVAPTQLNYAFRIFLYRLGRISCRKPWSPSLGSKQTEFLPPLAGSRVTRISVSQSTNLSFLNWNYENFLRNDWPLDCVILFLFSNQN